MSDERDTYEEPTLRDVIAIVAMHALLARDLKAMHTDVVARHAYAQADAMLDERERAK